MPAEQLASHAQVAIPPDRDGSLVESSLAPPRALPRGRRRLDPERATRRLVRQLEALGHVRVVPSCGLSDQPAALRDDLSRELGRRSVACVDHVCVRQRLPIPSLDKRLRAVEAPVQCRRHLPRSDPLGKRRERGDEPEDLYVCPWNRGSGRGRRMTQACLRGSPARCPLPDTRVRGSRAHACSSACRSGLWPDAGGRARTRRRSGRRKPPRPVVGGAPRTRRSSSQRRPRR
jgi:hypothetical protein